METKLAKTLVSMGVTGIAIALIALIWFLIQSNNTIVGNHIDHSTEAIIQNTKVLTELTASVTNSNEVQGETVQVLRELKDVIRYGQ